MNRNFQHTKHFLRKIYFFDFLQKTDKNLYFSKRLISAESKKIRYVFWSPIHIKLKFFVDKICFKKVILAEFLGQFSKIFQWACIFDFVVKVRRTKKKLIE